MQIIKNRQVGCSRKRKCVKFDRERDNSRVTHKYYMYGSRIFTFIVCIFKVHPFDRVKPLFCIRLKFAQEILSELYYLVTSGFTGASYKLNFGETLMHQKHHMRGSFESNSSACAYLIPWHIYKCTRVCRTLTFSFSVLIREIDMGFGLKVGQFLSLPTRQKVTGQGR